MSVLIEEMGGVGVFGVISVCLFVLVFGGAVFLACRLKKPFLNNMGSLPLNDGSTLSPSENWGGAGNAALPSEKRLDPASGPRRTKP